MPSERNFGLVFFGFFCTLEVWLYFETSAIAIWPFFSACVILLTSIYFPKIIRPANIVWHLIGQGLGGIISPIVLFAIFLLIFLPTGLFMRLFKNDPLNLNIEKNKHSYWVFRDPKSPTSMKNQF